MVLALNFGADGRGFEFRENDEKSLCGFSVWLGHNNIRRESPESPKVS